MPRLPWGPEIPPAGTDADRKFTQRLLAMFGLIGLLVGVIYASGIGNNHRGAGFLLIGLSIAMIYPYWLVGHLHQRRRDERSRDT